MILAIRNRVGVSSTKGKELLNSNLVHLGCRLICMTIHTPMCRQSSSLDVSLAPSGALEHCPQCEVTVASKKK